MARIKAFAPTFEVASQNKNNVDGPIGYQGRTCVELTVVQSNGEVLMWDLSPDAALVLSNELRDCAADALEPVDEEAEDES